MAISSGYFTFARLRIFALSYIAAVSFLTFAIGIFALPTAGAKHAPALAVVVAVSLILGLVASAALIVPKIQKRRQIIRRGRIYVGAEVLCCIASVPLFATAIYLEVALAALRTLDLDSDVDASRKLSVFLLVFTGSNALILVLYAGLIGGLAIHTHRRTQRASIWFADAAAHIPPFSYPASLTFLYTSGDEDSIMSDVETARAVRRVRLDERELDPGVIVLARQMRARERSAHTIAPDCACGEKLARGPVHAEEYRAMSRVYARIWTVIAEREAIARARSIGGGHRRAMSAPVVPIFRLPTERERRRSVYFIELEGARFWR